MMPHHVTVNECPSEANWS